MKKILIGILVGIFLSTAAHAIVQQNPWTATRFHGFRVNVVYEKDENRNDTDAIKNVFLKGNSSVLDSTGAVVGSHNEARNWSQLPAEVKACAKTVGKYIGKEINLAAVNENVEPNLP